MIYFMKTWDAALARFQQFEQLLKTQIRQQIKMLNIDNAKKYTKGQFKTYVDSHGIVLCTTAPYSPMQNGIGKRLNRTLAERARTMLLAHDSPKFL